MLPVGCGMRILFVLTTAGIVSSEDEAHSERERWQEALSTSAELFQHRDYSPLAGCFILFT